ncbi:hypothetical protein [Pseudomonas sp. W5-01]|uniref:hypothetical protein n=1 Tax=Pseudomonas sp. W5-01 TaxID=3097454 RepID=UPI00397DDA40
MAVIIDIQSLLPRMTAVGTALDMLAQVTDGGERVSHPTTPEQQAAMQKVNIERGKLYEDLLTLLVKPPAKRAAETAALRAVFAQVSQCLKDQPHALETLEAYREDGANSHSDVARLRGFLQGLCAGRALQFEDYCEVDALIVSAFGL